MLDKLREARNLASRDLAFKLSYWVTDEEAEFLYSFTKEKGIKLVFESGTCHGFSSSWFAAAGATVYTFDVADRPKIWSVNKELESPNIHCTIAPYKDGVVALLTNMFAKREGNAIFFLDGGHSRNDIYQEWLAIKPFLIKGDYVMVHDIICERGGVRFWHQLSNEVTSGAFFSVHKTKRGMGQIDITSDKLGETK